MYWIWVLTALAQLMVLCWLGYGAKKRFSKVQSDILPVDAPLPVVGMIIPAAGNHPQMPQALRSLLQQDYPALVPVIVTATDTEDAASLVRCLQKEFPALRHVVAGEAEKCGQKNHNTLQAIAALEGTVDIYAFCDSTHMAQPDFIRQLVLPIVRGESSITTGYHAVNSPCRKLVIVAYQLCVLLMRLMQAAAVFTQPWGGAMAMRQQVFQELSLKSFWGENVVDDCSLASLLLQRKIPVTLCPQALLRTEVTAYPFSVWRAWMDRQILFLKFCIPAQWVLLGIFACILLLPLCVSLLMLLGALIGKVSFFWGVISLLHVSLLCGLLASWRVFVEERLPLLVWVCAFIVSAGMFAYVYVRTLLAKGILWHGIYYHVARGGRVLSRQRIAAPR